MKHVFFIHSSITYLVALKVMEVEELPAEACVFLFYRSFTAPDCPVEHHQVPQQSYPTLVAFWKIWRKIAWFDQFISRITGGKKFHVYCPHTSHDLIRILVTHPRCRGFSYIEEGLASYVERADLNVPFSFKLNVVRYLYTRGRIPNLQFSDLGYLNAYCMDEEGFPGLPRKTVIPLPFKKLNPLPPFDLNGQSVLAFDALVEVNIVTAAAFEAMLHRFFQYLLKQQVQTLYFKFHPVQVQDQTRRKFYLDIMEQYAASIRFVELPVSLSLEDTAYTFRNMIFYNIVSSVGLYAHFCGHEVRSLLKIMVQEQPDYQKRVDKFPAVFFKYFKIIE